jgi:hypothetical protein
MWQGNHQTQQQAQDHHSHDGLPGSPGLDAAIGSTSFERGATPVDILAETMPASFLPETPCHCANHENGCRCLDDREDISVSFHQSIPERGSPIVVATYDNGATFRMSPRSIQLSPANRT